MYILKKIKKILTLNDIINNKLLKLKVINKKSLKKR